MSANDTPQIDPLSLKRMRERTREAREHEAGEIFSITNISAKLSAAAAKGQSAAILAPSVPMDIQETETGKAIKSMLEQAGFFAEWKTARPPDSEPHSVLRVSWGMDAKPPHGD